MMDTGRRIKLIGVFQDTKKFLEEDAVLAASVEYAQQHTNLYEADDYPALSPVVRQKKGEIQVIQARTFEAAMSMRRDFPNAKIAVLNFASATNPGGGVENGSGAQEESLCRCSTLFPTLNQKWLWEKYYGINLAAQDYLHTDACIYSPDIVICKTDEDIPQRMKPEDYTTVDVITCAAPNLRHASSKRYNLEQLYELHVRRAKHILHIAAANGVDILILGAFGCGAFENDPQIVAKAYHTAVEGYRERFDTIVFAIYCWGPEIKNFNAFSQELGQLRVMEENV